MILIKHGYDESGIALVTEILGEIVARFLPLLFVSTDDGNVAVWWERFSRRPDESFEK